MKASDIVKYFGEEFTIVATDKENATISNDKHTYYVPQSQLVFVSNAPEIKPIRKKKTTK